MDDKQSLAVRRRDVLSGASIISAGTAAVLLGATSAGAQSTATRHPDLYSTAPTRLQSIGDTRLAYRRFGKEGAVPVICLQHFTGTMNNFDPIHGNRLAQDRPVILVDYRGVGRSEGAPPLTVKDMAADIIAFIRAQGPEQVDVFGFSLGGFVAQQVAIDAPDIVRRLILAGTGPAGGEGMDDYTPQVKEIIARQNTTPEQRRLELFFAPTPTSRAAGEAWQARIAARQTDREPESGAAIAQAQLAAIMAWGKAPANRYADLARITQRMLVVNGKDDIMVPTVNSYILQQRLPDARLILYPDSGHGAHFQFAGEFADAAAGFLNAA